MGMDVGASHGGNPRGARGVGNKGRHQPEMNVTPLVDVVLVLLIVFMVMTAMMNEHFWVHVPEKDKQEQTQEEPSEGEAPIVVTVNKSGQIQINQDVFPDREFPARLRRMLVARGELRVYFDAQDGVSYERAVEAMDLTRGAGAAHIAVVTEKLQD